MRLGVGKSVAGEARTAAREAVAEASRTVERGSLALAFSTCHLEPDALAQALAAELGDMPWIGCCSAGLIAGPTLLRRGVVVGILDAGEDARVGIGVAGPVTENARICGQRATRRALDALPLLSPDRSRLVIALLKLGTDCAAEAVRGAALEGGSDVLWAGGGAGDNFGYVRSAQYALGESFSDHMVVAALDVPGPLGVGLAHGWQPRGPVTMVTRSEGSRVLELDYSSAFEVYREIATLHGEQVDPAHFTRFAMMHPLGIPVATGSHLIRDPLQVDANGSLDCVAEIPEGSLVRMMNGRPDYLLEASRRAASDACAGLGERAPGGALLFDCYSRMLALEQDFPRELASVQQTLGSDVPLIGCLTLGEVGSVDGSVPQFHNKTAVVTAF